MTEHRGKLLGHNLCRSGQGVTGLIDHKGAVIETLRCSNKRRGSRPAHPKFDWSQFFIAFRHMRARICIYVTRYLKVCLAWCIESGLGGHNLMSGESTMV